MSKDCFVNPATGLPLADENCAIDINGSPYGMDIHEDIFESSFDDTGSCFDDWDSFSSMTSFDDGWL